MSKINDMAEEITDMSAVHACDLSLPAAYRRFCRAFHEAAIANPLGLRYFLYYGAQGAAEDPEAFADLVREALEDNENNTPE